MADSSNPEDSFPKHPEPQDVLDRLPASFPELPPRLLAATLHRLAEYYDGGYPEELWLDVLDALPEYAESTHPGRAMIVSGASRKNDDVDVYRGSDHHARSDRRET